MSSFDDTFMGSEKPILIKGSSLEAATKLLKKLILSSPGNEKASNELKKYLYGCAMKSMNAEFKDALVELDSVMSKSFWNASVAISGMVFGGVSHRYGMFSLRTNIDSTLDLFSAFKNVDDLNDRVNFLYNMVFDYDGPVPDIDDMNTMLKRKDQNTWSKLDPSWVFMAMLDDFDNDKSAPKNSRRKTRVYGKVKEEMQKLLEDLGER